MLKERQKIKIRMFFELMGWPPEALNNSLEQIIGHLKKTWKITKEEYSQPEKIQREEAGQGETGQKPESAESKQEETPKKREMFSSHVEIEAEISNLSDLFMVVLNFGPSVIEIIEPAEIVLNANELQDIMADTSGKVNAMDMDVKILAAQLKQATDILQKLQKKPETEKEAENKAPEDGSKFTI